MGSVFAVVVVGWFEVSVMIGLVDVFCVVGLGHTSYLSFFLHEQNFWRIKFTPKMPIFCVKSVKIYTGQKKFTRASLVGS